MSVISLSRSAAVAALMCLSGCGLMPPPPADLDYARTRLSDQGQYRVSYASELTPPPVSRLHSWTLHLETSAGRPVDGATILIDGDMPQHGHGLPTRPSVTRALGNGDYLVEGMKFQMGGWWQIYLDISADGRQDKATFNLQLE